jgi:hypothetical protein
MKRSPTLYRLRELFEGANSCSTQLPNGKWVPARLMGFFHFPTRVRIAWGVFTGRYDAVVWPEDDPSERGGA